MKMNVSRVEEKYILTRMQALNLYAKLKNILPGDEINGTKPYRVRSLYFDSYWNDDYFDKLDGVEVRKKIRLRTYPPDGRKAKLELKQKNGSYQYKQSVTVTKEQAEALEQGEYKVLLTMENSLAEELYYIFLKERYRPGCIVEYMRQAFQVPVNNIRITFDSDIRGTEGSLRLFDWSEERTVPIESKNKVILEVKYNHFLLSYIKDALAASNASQEAYSKYVTGRYYGL